MNPSRVEAFKKVSRTSNFCDHPRCPVRIFIADLCSTLASQWPLAFTRNAYFAHTFAHSVRRSDCSQDSALQLTWLVNSAQPFSSDTPHSSPTGPYSRRAIFLPLVSFNLHFLSRSSSVPLSLRASFFLHLSPLLHRRFFTRVWRIETTLRKPPTLYFTATKIPWTLCTCSLKLISWFTVRLLSITPALRSLRCIINCYAASADARLIFY